MRNNTWVLAICVLVSLTFSHTQVSKGQFKNPFVKDSASQRRQLQYYPRPPATDAGPADEQAGHSTTVPLHKPTARYTRTTKDSERSLTSILGLKKRSAKPASVAETPAARKSNAAPKTKNYFDELFAAEAASKASTATTAVKPASKSPESTVKEARLPVVSTTPAPPWDEKPQKATAPRLPDGLSIETEDVAEAKTPSTSHLSIMKAPAIVTANHLEMESASKDAKIQQVNATRDTTEESAPEPELALQRPVVTLPSANAQVPAVTAEWVKHGNVHVGKECQFDLVVRNTSDAPAVDLVVEAFFPTTVRLTDAKPAPQQATDRLSWQFDSLDPGATKTIQISMIPSRRGQLATSARVRFTGMSAGVFRVEEPMLDVVINGPTEVRLGDPASQTVTLSNPGTGVTQAVAVEVAIPEGLDHPRGKHLKMEIGSLQPGESRTVRLSLAAVAGGEQPIQLVAHSGNELSREVVNVIHVIAPSIQIAAEGPGLRFLGRQAKYAIHVSNDGAAATNNVRVFHQVPDGFEFIAADQGGEYDAMSRTVSWFVGHLDAKSNKTLHVTLNTAQLGSFEHTIRATSEQGVGASTTVATRIDGTASLVLEVVDLDDPVEVGTETAYEIRVRNDGSKAAENVAIVSELPKGATLLAAKGPTQHQVAEGGLIFEPIRRLDPGKSAIFRVHVRGTQEGNLRFRTQLTSNSVPEPLVMEELTRFYAD